MLDALVAAEAFGLTFADWGLVLLAIYFVLDTAGLGRGSRTIRRQNADLTERNRELEKQREEDRTIIQQLRDEIKKLESRVRELERNDQAAVLDAIGQLADQQHQTVELLTEIHATLKEGTP